jgi:hypothetical protein
MDTLNLLVAALGAVAAIAATVISWLVYQGQKADSRPVISSSLEPFENSSLFVLRVNLGGRSPVAWEGIEISVLAPHDALIVSKSKGLSQDETGQEGWDLGRATRALARTQPMSLVSQPYYPVQLSSRYIGGNVLGYVWEEFLVKVPSSTEHRLQVQLSLRSQDADARTLRVTIKRDVPR